MTAPTRVLGRVSEDYGWGTVLNEWLETVPDLLFPASIPVYHQMRKDPQLAAVLSAYTLQLRRASWQVDGRGCRPEVVRQVADDLGLHVAGEDAPGAARTRGVSWNEHLRYALTHLAFGFAGFELQAEMVDGRARLVGLWERPQHTIDEIHADPKTGAFLGVSQEVTSGTAVGKPQIPASRMVWYCHEREGSSWQGMSLLRPAYGPWLFKRELMRVLSTSSRRFGMGVPTVEWAPGTNPTPAQIAEAQRFASAARVGDTSGASLPPGASLILRGLSGSVPDTLGYIKWLDQQMSRMALAGHIDLGETSNGSRALGESFIDLLMMALESIGENIADTITRQAAARIVEWNFGDEAVPRVTVSGIGAQRVVTAQSLQMLLQSGALSADPALEAWVRREYRLPEQEESPQPTPTARSKPTPKPEAEPEPTEPEPQQEPAAHPAVQASRRPPRPKRAEPAGQLALPILAASPPPGVDAEAIQRAWQQELDRLAQEWPAAADPMVGEIVAAIVAAVAAGTLPELVASAGIVVSAGALAAMAGPLAASLLRLARLSAEQATAEIRAQGVTLRVPGVDEDGLAARAQAAARVVANGYVNSAQQAALGVAAPGIDADVVGERVREHLDGIGKTAKDGESGRGWVLLNLRQALTHAQGAGRMAAFEALVNAGHSPVFVASEVNDNNRCVECAAIDGHRFESLTAAAAAYGTGRYRLCLGRDRCRGFLYVVLGD